MTDREAATPNPGSDEAVAQGCTCPTLDNARGDADLAISRGGFWVSPGCPVHIPVSADALPQPEAPTPCPDCTCGTQFEWPGNNGETRPCPTCSAQTKGEQT